MLSFLFCWACQSGQQQAPTLPTGQWHELLANYDAADWEKRGDFEVKPEQGELILANNGQQQGGWLVHKAMLQDFRLETEFRADPLLNGGIALRMQQPPPVYEVNLLNDADQQNPTGSIVDLARAKWLDSLDTRNWNQLAVEVKGDHLVVWINGEKVCETHDRKSTSGHLALEGPKQGGEVRLRQLRLMPLEPVEVVGPSLEERALAHQAPLVPLFDGSSFEGWEKVGQAKWSIEDSVLHGYSGKEGGFLATRQSYGDFYLKLKFKIAFEDNSGIFIRRPPAEAVNPNTSLECNIYDFNGLAHPYSTGSIVGYARAFRGLVDYDEWNEMEIFALGDHVVLRINGRKSAEAHVAAAHQHEGQICLQAGIKVFDPEKGPSDIYFKDILLKDLSQLK